MEPKKPGFQLFLADGKGNVVQSYDISEYGDLYGLGGHLLLADLRKDLKHAQEVKKEDVL